MLWLGAKEALSQATERAICLLDARIPARVDVLAVLPVGGEW
jgi:hypothetical protein